jgi:hypothetical protein
MFDRQSDDRTLGLSRAGLNKFLILRVEFGGALQRRPPDLDQMVAPAIRALIARDGVNLETELARLNPSDWPG